MTETTRLRMWMKYTICTIALLLIGCRISTETLNSPAAFTISDAERFAGLALGCVHKEYPNKLLLLSHRLPARPCVKV
jgi:hypothetical protein